MAKRKPSQTAPAAPQASLSEQIASLADAHGRLDWPNDVVVAMQALKDEAERVQAVVDAATASGSKIGDLAATLDGASGPEQAPECEAG